MNLFLTLLMAYVTHVTPTSNPNVAIYNIVIQENPSTLVWDKIYGEPGLHLPGDTIYVDCN